MNINLGVPFPTEEQCNNFVEHLINAHSWYKHLPILSGGEFLIFLDGSVGWDYPLCHPKIKSGNTREGYINDFGFLNYIYRIDDVWSNDGNSDINDLFRRIPSNVIEKCCFKLYPMISEEFEEAYSIHKNEFKRLKDENHPYLDLLISWEEFHNKKEKLWNLMSEEEQDIIVHTDFEISSGEGCSERVQDYILYETNEYSFLEEIRKIEILKINESINNLRAIACNI